MRLSMLAVMMAVGGAPVLAQDAVTPDVALFTGNAEAGLESFNRQCAACHVVVNEAGETLAGRNARTGPNQYGLAYDVIGSEPDFDYSDAILQLRDAGERWTEEKFVAYVQDPTEWLREATGDNRARGKMSFQLRDEEAAHDIWAYLVSISPELTGDAAAAYTEDSAASE